jgi:hypothetical protein
VRLEGQGVRGSKLNNLERVSKGQCPFEKNSTLFPLKERGDRGKRM